MIKVFSKGFFTGILLQLAIGPVFFYLMNLTIQKTWLDGIAGVVAVAFVDYFYIFLAILGIGKLIKKEIYRRIFSIVGPIILIVFGSIIIKGSFDSNLINNTSANSSNIFNSFISLFILTLLNPMTIIFFTSIFATKALEYNYNNTELTLFGIGCGFATLFFLSLSVTTIYLLKEIINIPVLVVKALNIFVGLLLILYGMIRLKNNKKE